MRALLEHFSSRVTLSEVATSARLPLAQIRSIASILLQLGSFLSQTSHPREREKQQTRALLPGCMLANACNLGCRTCDIAKSLEHMEQKRAKHAIDAIFRSALRHK